MLTNLTNWEAFMYYVAGVLAGILVGWVIFKNTLYY